MDPNDALEQLRDELRRVNYDRGWDGDLYVAGRDAWAEPFEALDNWLSRGGFLPDAWKR